MSLEDRDWYREDLARRAASDELRRRRAKWRGLRQAVAMLAITVGAIILVAPPVLASRCDLVGRNIQPVACWGYSWAALSARVAGNMAATRGYPVFIVQTR